MNIYKQHIAESNFDNKAKQMLEQQIVQFHSVLDYNSKKNSHTCCELNK